MAPIESSSPTISCRGAAYLGREAGRTIVWIRGERDISNEAALCRVVARAIALDDADLVVDLSGSDFMDAGTVGVIVRARELLRLMSRSLTVRSPSEPARHVIEMCGLEDLLEPCPGDATHMSGTGGALGTLAGPPATSRSVEWAVALGLHDRPARAGTGRTIARRVDDPNRSVAGPGAP